jgi:hypothetical protein
MCRTPAPYTIAISKSWTNKAGRVLASLVDNIDVGLTFVVGAPANLPHNIITERRLHPSQKYFRCTA